MGNCDSLRKRRAKIAPHPPEGTSSFICCYAQAKEAGELDPRYKVPGYPQMTGMHAMMSPEQIKKLNANPLTRGMAPNWFHHLQGLHAVVRVLPDDLYERVVSGKGEIAPGASVPGGKFGGHEHMHH